MTQYLDSKLMAVEAEEKMDCLQEFPEHPEMIDPGLTEGAARPGPVRYITLIVEGNHFEAQQAVSAACSKFSYKFFQEFTQNFGWR